MLVPSFCRSSEAFAGVFHAAAPCLAQADGDTVTLWWFAQEMGLPCSAQLPVQAAASRELHRLCPAVSSISSPKSMPGPQSQTLAGKQLLEGPRAGEHEDTEGC